jgi:hypothetical protein
MSPRHHGGQLQGSFPRGTGYACRTQAPVTIVWIATVLSRPDPFLAIAPGNVEDDEMMEQGSIKIEELDDVTVVSLIGDLITAPEVQKTLESVSAGSTGSWSR